MNRNLPPGDLLREHREEWASYIENWSAAVGPEPPRAPHPAFGVIAANPAFPPATTEGSAD